MPEEPRTRYRATVHYDGTAFHGWQSQPHGRTVQDALEAALARLFGTPVRLTAAGRTDAGVHAVGQEVAFDAPTRWTARELQRALNAVTPDEIWVQQCSPTAGDFHPRFDATGRRYEYLVGLGPEACSPLRRGRIWPLGRNVDWEALHEATAYVPGERSFAAFARKRADQADTRCRVEEVLWARPSGRDLAFLIVADRFLHRMVRYLVATLLEVGMGRRSVEEVRQLLAGAANVRPPVPAPPQGLYLTGVRYAGGWNREPGVPGLLRWEETGGNAVGSRGNS